MAFIFSVLREGSSPCSHFLYEQVWLLERRKVATFVQVVPIQDIRIPFFGPRSWSPDNFFGVTANAGWQFYRVAFATTEGLVEAFPIESG
jgi:hypothetical protein